MAADEELELDDIQGSIIPGFKKDYSLIIGLFIEDVPGCKAWLKVQSKEVALASEVLAFNRLHLAMRRRRGSENGAPAAVWKSISFSTAGLALLRPGDKIKDAFEDKFVAGMYGDETLHDPPGAQWKMGGSAATTPHILIVLAADRESDLDAEATRLLNEIGASGGGGLPALRLSGPPQKGATLPKPLTGHEHFGFKDGISQPAIRGLASKNPTDFFDTRLLAPTDPNFTRFAEPGRPLVWPGQFLIGYNRQDPRDALKPIGPAPLTVEWQKNGSYLVYRRLQQKVHLFWQFCEAGAQALGAASGQPMAREFFASRLVGRWPSGAPLMRAPAKNDDSLANDDMSNNNFRFSNPTPVVTLKDGTQASSAYPAPVADPDGRTCPFVGHIRKVNPRDDPTDANPLVKLMLRRGIPFGPPQDRTKLLEDDGVDRGLLFMAYQAAITDQFDFVTQTWVDGENSPHDSDPPMGHDPLIGQAAGARFIRLPVDGDTGHDQQMALPDPDNAWVVMTGGGYFFTPSVSALAGALAGGPADSAPSLLAKAPRTKPQPRTKTKRATSRQEPKAKVSTSRRTTKAKRPASRPGRKPSGGRSGR
jgi:Dyp-type peroxidase family